MDTQNNNTSDYIKMDFTLETPEERKAKVEEIIANTPPEKLTPYYLERLTDYIIMAMDKQEKKKKKILTENRMVTINKRESSLEGYLEMAENGNEDWFYNYIIDDKNALLSPKISITPQDIKEVPGLKELREAIEKVEEQRLKATGKKAKALYKELIELRQDQYVLKESYYRPVRGRRNIPKNITKIDLSEKVTVDEKGNVKSTGLINLYDPKHVSALLCNYSKLKEDSWDCFNSDFKWMMEDLDILVDKTLREAYPLYYDLLIYKIDGLSNLQIQELLNNKYGIKHSVEYISSLWRNKIPNLIAQQAAEDWIIWHYTEEERGKWKRCSRCGQIKLAHPFFFSRNNTSKDHFYSICKKCRNKKKG